MAKETEQDHELSSGDSAFTERLQQLRPVPSSIALEQVLYRAGYEAALQRRSQQVRSWSNFLKGACSGALAASLVWFSSTLTYWNIAPSTESGLVKQSIHESTPSTEVLRVASPDVAPAPAPSLASNQPEPLKLVPRFESDLFQNSLSEIAKRQWDRRRLAERMIWISARSNESSKDDAEVTNPGKSNSLWLLRSQARERIDL